MLKQPPCRSSRSKGCKVKHVLQICIVLAVCIWLLNQLRHYYDKKESYQGIAGKRSEDLQNEFDSLKLGRKDLSNPRMGLAKTDLDSGSQDKEETDVEVEEIEPMDNDDVTTEEEESEEVEDLIDVDDREKEEGSDDQEVDHGKGDKSDDVDSLDDQAKSESKFSEAREKTYMGDDASSSVLQNSRALNSELEVAVLRRLHKTREIKKLTMDIIKLGPKIAVY